MLGYIYPYHKTYKHWLNPHNCASKTGLALTTLLDICEWLCNHTLVYFPYDLFKPNVDVHLKSNNEFLHFRTLTSYHIFPFLKQSQVTPYNRDSVNQLSTLGGHIRIPVSTDLFFIL